MSHTSQLKKRSIRVLGWLVVTPTLLVACFASLFAVAKLYGFVFLEGPATRHATVAHLKLFAMTALGWAGLLTGLRLYKHFLQSDAVPARPGAAWAGLFCGVVASISLIGWLGGSLVFRVCLAGWPLLGACTLAWCLAAAQKKVHSE